MSKLNELIEKLCPNGVEFYELERIVKEVNIGINPIEIQSEIVYILDKFTALLAELKAELEARQKQYEYYRDKLLTFKELVIDE